MSFKKTLGSDNHAGIHPQILKAIQDVNVGHSPSYGTDHLTQKCQEVFKSHFGEQSKTHFVFNGTAANILAISTMVKSFESVVCTDISHLNNDECGAPEKHLGCKLIAVKSMNGKLTPEDIQAQLIRRGDQHFSQVKAVSITQPTEVGTCYTYQEMKAISELCKAENLYLHIDGARFIYAPLALDKTYKELTTDLGVDVLSFGGTKNGLLFGEAVVFLNPTLEDDFKFIRKQAMQLPSKMRFLAAQFTELLGTGPEKKVSSEGRLDQQMARNNSALAKYFAERLSTIEEIKICYAPEANSVFPMIPKRWTKKLKDKYFFYVWDPEQWVMRWMLSFDTSREEIDDFVDTILETQKNEAHSLS